MWMVRDARWGLRNGVEGIVFWMVIKKLCLKRALKYFVWTVVEILHLDGHQNSSFGRSSKFFVWTVMEICLLDRHPKFGLRNSFWMGVKKFLFGGPDKLMDNA